MKLLTGGWVLFFGQVLSGAISSIAIVITARYCGAGIFTYLSVAVTLLSVSLDAIDFGACAWATREFSGHKITPQAFLAVVSAKVKLVTAVSLLSSVTVLIVSRSLALFLLVLLYAPLWLLTNYIQNFLQVTSKFGLSVSLQIGERMLWLSIIIFAALSTQPEFAFVLPMLLGLFFHALIGTIIIHIQSRTHEKGPKIRQGELFRKSRHFGLNSILTDVSSLDTFLVSKILGASRAGSYVLGQRFRNPLTIGFTIFSIRIRNALAKKDLGELRSTVREEAPLIIANTVGLILLIVICANYGGTIFGNSYIQANLILSLCVANSLLVGTNIVFINILNAIGQEYRTFRTIGIGIPMQLIIIGVGAYHFQVSGAVFALIITNLFLSILLSQIVKKRIPEHFQHGLTNTF